MIYLDNAATTKIFDSVNQKISQINSENFFNPSALYQEAMNTHLILEQARDELAKNMGATGDHIIFTSGATESNNTAINGFATNKKDAEYIFSSGEHPSVYNVANSFKTQNRVIKFINISKSGIVEPDELKKLLTPNTHFVSIMHVSNETGAINDIKSLCKIVKDYNPKIIFHCDGTQAFTKIPVNVKDLGVDAYTISAHKFHGPKGVGALYVRDFNSFKPYIIGGGQQSNLRSGTENVSGYVGMAMASSIAIKELESNYAKITEFRNLIKQKITNHLEDFIFNESKNNSPYILSISFKGIRGEVLLHKMDDHGVIIGIGSACSSKKQGNRTLEQMGVPKEYLLGSIRLSLSCDNTLPEIQKACSILIEQCKELKESMSK